MRTRSRALFVTPQSKLFPDSLLGTYSFLSASMWDVSTAGISGLTKIWNALCVETVLGRIRFFHLTSKMRKISKV